MQQSTDTFQHVIGDSFGVSGSMDVKENPGGWVGGVGVPVAVKYRRPYAITFTVVTHSILCIMAEFWQSCQVSQL